MVLAVRLFCLFSLLPVEQETLNLDFTPPSLKLPAIAPQDPPLEDVGGGVKLCSTLCTQTEEELLQKH